MSDFVMRGLVPIEIHHCYLIGGYIIVAAIALFAHAHLHPIPRYRGMWRIRAAACAA